MLFSNGVDVVLDVGASTGGFAIELFRCGFEGRVVSFEPLPTSHDALRLAAANNSRWTIAERVALGNASDTVTMNVSANSGSSSILPIAARHLEAAPRSEYLGTVAVQMVTLDHVFEEFVAPSEVAFLKLDVQGYERAVLEGAQHSLSRIAGVQTELSFETLYEGQSLFWELSHQLIALGFAPWAFFPAFTEAETGRMLQVDGVFFRSPRVDNVSSTTE